MAEPIHILFLIDTFFGGTGGAEGALARVVRNLPKDRFRCSVITFRADPTGKHTSELDCPLHVFPLERTYDWNALRTAFRLRRFIRDHRVTLAHTFFETSDVWGAPIAKLSGCRYLISSRRDMGILRKAKHRLFYRLLAPIYDQVQTVSNEVGAFAIRQDRLNPTRVTTVYNGIDPSRFGRLDANSSVRQQLGIPAASPVVLSVGNIRRVKGFDVLLNAAAIVCAELPATVFLIAGNPHERHTYGELLAQRAALGLDRNVMFLGERGDISGLLTLANAFLLPSRSEGLSNALLEAMASQLPVVATRVGGNAEVVSDGESGYLVESEDAAGIAERLLELLQRPEQAAQMGRTGRAIVERRFTVQAMVDRMVSLYDALLGK